MGQRENKLETNLENKLETKLETKLVKVVGDRTAKVLEKVFSYQTIADLIRHYPRRYLVRVELSDIA